MYDKSILHNFIKKQHNLVLAYQLLDQDDLAYCAMCDAIHVNDAQCQRMD